MTGAFVGGVTVIVAHMDRLRDIDALAAVARPQHVFVDDGRFGEWENHRRALEWASRRAAQLKLSHVCILQDDAVPVADFQRIATGLTRLRPDDMLGLYVGTHRPYEREVTAATREADARGAIFLSYPGLLWGVGTILPATYIPALLDACDRSKRPYDTRLGRAWMRVRGEEKPVLYPWPSLVDHRDEDPVVKRSKPQGVRVARRVGNALEGWHPFRAAEAVPIVTGRPPSLRRGR